VVLLDPTNTHWIEDASQRQRHINASVAYNIWQYYQVSQDTSFLFFYGAEMLLQMARFWASIAEYNAATERYEIRFVVGPDEYHVRYPDSETPGIHNNAYTNMMASWSLARALDVLAMLPAMRREELVRKLRLSEEEFHQWDLISHRLRVDFITGRVIEQYEGFHRLEDVDLDAYRVRHPNLQRIDAMLIAEGKSVEDYQVVKQADVLMLFYLFSPDEFCEIMQRLGYDFDRDDIQANIDYYLPRTSHASTLSRIATTFVLATVDHAHSWQLFREALQSDVADIQGGTTSEGIHLGAMGGTVDIAQRCYTGLVTRNNVLWLNPHLPDVIEGLALKLRYRNHSLTLRFSREMLEVSSDPTLARPIQIGFQSDTYLLEPGGHLSFPLTAVHQQAVAGTLLSG
jgi:alpha,alpha-trehalase